MRAAIAWACLSVHSAMWAACIGSPTCTVKAGGGGSYTTIQACVNAMANGDTCTVFAGTYGEHVSLSAGGVATYKTLQANVGDLVYVLDFTMASHTKVIGFQIQNIASPASHNCVDIPNGTTDYYVTNNVLYACGGQAMIGEHSNGGSSVGYIQGNTLSYGCSTSSAPNICSGIIINGAHHLVENNDMSHVFLGIILYGDHNVIRNNAYHDVNGSANTAGGDCGTNTGNCHPDFVFSEPNTTTGAHNPPQYNVIENNKSGNISGANSKGYLFQANTCQIGGVNQCFNAIVRFNTDAHFGSGAITDDNAFDTVDPGFSFIKVYNNTFVDYNQLNFANGLTANHSNNSTNAAEINNLFYYPASGTINPYRVDASSLTGWVAKNNLAFCIPGPCTFHASTLGSGNWTDDPGNVQANPLFANYATNNFALTAGSPAIGAGAALTTVAAGDSGSGTSLIVNDASFFQDGYTITGVSADCISVTTVGNHVCITGVNYSTNTLTLASGITRSSGDSVWLYSDSTGRQVLTGNAPNIGSAVNNCSISITSPTNNSVVSGPIALTATTTGCPSAVRYEWKVFGQPLWGDGTYENSYTVPTCSAGSCTGSYQMRNGFGNYNASYLWDGTWPLTVQVLDSTGTVLATSGAVNIILNDFGKGSPSGCKLTGPNFSLAQSGTITITMDCSALTGLAGVFAGAVMNLFVDGRLAASNGSGNYTDTFTYDTTELEDGSDHLVWVSVQTAGAGLTGQVPAFGAFAVMTTSNGSTFRELRMNYRTVYLWLGGTTTVSLFARGVSGNNTETAINATYVSGTPSAATVGSCVSVASCAVTAVGQGTSIITATDGSGHTATTRVVVQPGTPIFPHFGYDGSVCTAYNAGNCTPNKSGIFRDMFDDGAHISGDANLPPAMVAAGFNVFEYPWYSSAYSVGDTTAWQSVQAAAPFNSTVNAALAAGPFQSFLGRCDAFLSNGQNLQYSADPNFSGRMSYLKSTMQGKLLACVDSDELSIPVLYNFASGQIGTTNGPTSITVSAGTPNVATITWPNIGQATSATNLVYQLDLTGADNSCFLADGPNGNGTGIQLGGSAPTYTWNTTCAVGTYQPSGGTLTETGLTLQVYNGLCPGVTSCQNNGPYNNTNLINNGKPGVPSYIQVASGGTGTVVFAGFDATGPLQLTVASATSTCLNVTNATLTRTAYGTFTYPTNGCPSAIYGPAYNGEATATLNLHCGGSCTLTGTLNRAIPNNVLQTIQTQLNSFTPPIQMDFPWAGAATTNVYALSRPMAGWSDIFWTRDGPEAAGEHLGLPNAVPVRTFPLSLENHFWTQAWPGINQTLPIGTIVGGAGPWYTRGGAAYTLGTTSGSQFTTTTPNNAAVGQQINAVGANCAANYNTAAGTGVAGTIASVQSNTTFTIGETPNCSGSGGTIYIAPNTAYFTPPYDRLKAAGQRATEIAVTSWDAITLGISVLRAFSYGASTPNGQVGAALTPGGNYRNYPATATNAYCCGNQSPPDSPNNEDNDTGIVYTANDSPSSLSRWNAHALTNTLIQALQPELIQPMCDAPDFGPRIHTGAKCSAAGTLVIAISDNEVPMTLNFPTSLWSLYNEGGAPVTRLEEIKAAYVKATNIAGAATSDSLQVDGGEVVFWWFPSGNTPLAQPVAIGANPASVGATQTAFRYSYLCNPSTFASNLDQQAAYTVFGSSTSFALLRVPGIPICYDYQYLDRSNNPVGAKSAVQVLK